MAKMLHLKKPAEKFLRIARPAPAIIVIGASKGVAELLNEPVFFAQDGERMAGKAVRVDGKNLIVKLAVPGRDGLLYLTENEVAVKEADLEKGRALISNRQVKRFEAGAHLTLEKTFTPVYDCDDDGDEAGEMPNGQKPAGSMQPKVICDYLNVTFQAYASTFVSTTPIDRGGDYILPGAFTDTLPEFMKNPVMLRDHQNEVASIAGSWSKVGITAQGLAVEGKVSNSPDTCDTRFKLVEGHLKGLSIGGIWYYEDDGRGIHTADLFEISLVAVPMNPDALVRTLSLGPVDCRKAFARFWRSRKSLRTE